MTDPSPGLPSPNPRPGPSSRGRDAVSVAVCTFQGADFLRAQWESIVAQTARPAEIVLRDDGSTDGTLELVEGLRRAVDVPVRSDVNEDRLGSTANFARAISLCRGPLIVLADQDDVWLPTKVERLVAELTRRPKAAFAFSDAELVDPRLTPLGVRLWEAVGFTVARQRELLGERGFRLLLRRWVVTGATLAFRAEYRDLILPIPPIWVHDAWIALLLRAVAPCVLVPEPLILYRQHLRQQIGERKRSLYQQYRRATRLPADHFARTRDMFVAARDRLLDRGKGQVADWVFRELDAKIAHADRRATMREPGWRLPSIAGEAITGRYGRYSYGWKSCLQDLFL